MLCADAVSAGAGLADWSEQILGRGHIQPSSVSEIILRPALESLAEEHEMLRLFTSYPGIGAGAQTLGLVIHVGETSRRFTPRSAGIVYINFPYKEKTIPNINYTHDVSHLITNHWMQDLAKNPRYEAIISNANDAWDNYLNAASQMDPTNYNSLALSTMRYISGKPPSAIACPGDESWYSPEEQEAICQLVMPCVEAGIELERWIKKAGRGHWISYLVHGWENGVIPDSPTARRAGAVGAIPIAWDMSGGEIIDTYERRYHSGGTAGVAFCGETSGFVSGPAEELLPDNIRWSTAHTFQQDYPDFEWLQ